MRIDLEMNKMIHQRFLKLEEESKEQKKDNEFFYQQGVKDGILLICGILK